MQSSVVGFHRVIAALDVTSREALTVAAATAVAARLGVEVAGLFIEDINLLRLAALPITRHLSVGSAATTPLDADDLAAEMRTRAAQAAAELEKSAVRHGVKSSFRVVRGLPRSEIATATSTGDLLVVGSGPSVARLPLDLRSSLQATVSRAACSNLHVRSTASVSKPLLVIGANPHSQMRAVSTALHLAGRRDDLVVLLVGEMAAR
jgi:hypothetical protein